MAVEADALLHEEDRTVRVDLDGDRHEGEQRCKRDERDERHREIDHALDGERERIRGSGEDRDDRLTIHLVNLSLGESGIDDGRNETHRDPLLLAERDYRSNE